MFVHLAINFGASDRAGVEARITEAKRWLGYLVQLPDTVVGRIAWSAPGALYALACPPDEFEYIERCARDALVALRRADAVIGLGRHTPWLEAQLAVAAAAGLPTLNLSMAGMLPPRGESAQWWLERTHAALITQLRGVVAAVDRRRALAAERSP